MFHEPGWARPMARWVERPCSLASWRLARAQSPRTCLNQKYQSGHWALRKSGGTVGWIKDKSTSACVQQLFGGGLDFSHFFLASLGNEGEFQKLDARRYQSANLAEISSTSYTWGRGSSTSRSPALSALAGEVTKVVGGVPEAGLLESPTWGWFWANHKTAKFHNSQVILVQSKVKKKIYLWWGWP